MLQQQKTLLVLSLHVPAGKKVRIKCTVFILINALGLVRIPLRIQGEGRLLEYILMIIILVYMILFPRGRWAFIRI